MRKWLRWGLILPLLKDVAKAALKAALHHILEQCLPSDDEMGVWLIKRTGLSPGLARALAVEVKLLVRQAVERW